MVERSTLREAPQWSAGGWLGTLAPATRFILQGEPLARAAAADVIGVSSAEEPCRARTNGERAVLWLGPDELLLRAAAAEREALAGHLASALAGRAHSLVDVSHRQLALELSGRHAANLLNVGCPLDLDLTRFPVGMCTRTLFAKAEIVLWRTGDNRFQVEVLRSFAEYVARVFIEASQDFAPN